MPFLTHDLPRGGRHVTPPTTAPGASARTRLRQLLPVGLLVAATGAGVVAAPVIGSTASADGRHHGGGRPVGQAGAATSESALPQPALPQTGAPQAVTPGTGLVPAAYVLSSGKHRAADVGEPLTALTSPTGGKHRAGSGAHADTTRDAGGHAAKTSAAGASTTTGASSTSSTSSTASTAAPTATATSTPPAAAVTSATSPTSARGAAPAGSTSNGLVAGVVGTVTDVVGALLGGTD